MLTHNVTKLAKFLVPALPLMLAVAVTGCASESDSEPDQAAGANITGEEAAKELGHAALARSGIASVTPEAQELGIATWDVYAFEKELGNAKQKVNGAVAFGTGEDGQVRYAIVVDADRQKSAILRYDSEKIVDEYNADGANQHVTREELPAETIAAFKEEQKAIQKQLQDANPLMDCVAGLAAAAFGATLIGGAIYVLAPEVIASTLQLGLVWLGVDYVITDILLPGAVMAAGSALGKWVVKNALTPIEEGCGALLKDSD